jgi:hypothetical protein
MTDHQQHSRDSLQRAEPIPIAQLQPDIPNPDAHVVQGEVTITWPFSIVTKSIAFKLVETDFRLRFNKGQVRVDFHGAAAKAVAAAKIGGGDEIRLSLEGVEWVKSQGPARPDTLEWQLKFTHRLRLQVRRVDTREEEFIDIKSSGHGEEPIDGPAIDPPIEPSTPEPTPAVEVIPLPVTAAPATLPTKRVASSAFDDEYASPAFLKRARVSYGSLFEGGFDLFTDERKDRAKRKRPRFSMHANWRYASRTPSPEPEPQAELSDESEPEADEDSNPAAQAESSPRPPMIDEGCQTQVVDVTPAKPKQQAVETLPVEAATPATPTPNSPSRTPAVENERPSPVSVSMPEKQQQDAWGFSVPSPTRLNGLGAIPPRQQKPTQPLHPSFDTSNGTTYHASATVEAGRQDVNRGPAPEEPEAIEGPTQLPKPDDFYPKPMNFQTPTRSADRAAEQTSEAEEFTHDIVNQPPPFAPSQLEQASWSALTSLSQGQVPDASSFGNPEVIDSSSPVRAPSSGRQHDAGEFEDEQPEVSSPREEQGDGPQGMGYMQAEPVPADSEDVSMRSQAEADEDESENEYEDKDGGDLAGEDYDLRNYDDAQDDDVVESYDSSEVEGNESDPDNQAVDFEREDDEQDEMDEAEDGRDGWGETRGLARPGFLDEDGDVDADGEEFDEDYESEEYDYDGAEEEEVEADYDEEDRPTRKPVPAPKDPIFIDLLSDSEDGNEDEEVPEKQPAAPEKRTEDESEPIEKTPGERPEAEAGPVSKAAPETLKQEPAQEVIPPEIGEQPRETSLPQEDRMAIDEEPQQLDQPRGEVAVEDRGEDDNATEDHGISKESTRWAAAEESEHVEKHASEAMVLDVPETTQMEATEPLRVEVAATQVDDESKAGPEGEQQVAEEAGVGSAAAPRAMDGAEQLSAGGDGQSPLDSGHVASLFATIETHPSANAEVEVKEVATDPAVEEGPEELTRDVAMEPLLEKVPEEQTEEASIQPVVEEAPEEPAKEVVTEPAPEKDSEEPVVEEVSVEPAVEEVPAEPAVEEVSEEPTVQEVSEEQPTEEAAVQPAVEEALEESAVEFTEEQTVETTEEPAVEEPPQESIKEVAMEPAVEVEELPKETPVSKEQAATSVGCSVAPEQGTTVPADRRAEVQRPTTLSGGIVEAVITEAPGPPSAEDGGQVSAPQQEDDTSMTNVPQPEVQVTAVSPTSTQAHAEDTTMAKHPETVEEDEDRMDLVEHTGHPPTPSETQREEDTIMHVGEEDDDDDEDEDEDMEMSEVDYSFAAEQQIMTESQAYASQQRHEQTETLDQPRKAAGEEGSTQASAAPDGQRVTRSKAAARPEREILITAQSLRSWDHHRRHADTDDDPSIALAKAPDDDPEEDELQQGQPSTSPVIRATRRRGENGDPSVQLAKSYAPPTHKGGRRHVTPETTVDQTTSEPTGDNKSHKTTSELAAAEEEVPPSPSVTESSNADNSSQASVLKQKLTEDLRTNLGDFLPLKGLRGSLGKTADFIGVATATPEQPYRPKNGPRDYILELLLTDPESAPSNVVVALIYRPFQACLPAVHAGDVVLLRQFEVISVKGRGFGIRACDASAWAVFERAERLPQIKGPPVELSELEASHAEDVRKWWGLLDEKAMGRIEKATQKAIQAGKESRG